MEYTGTGGKVVKERQIGPLCKDGCYEKLGRENINAIHKSKHGPFSAAFCVGNFFGNNSSALNPYINSTKSSFVLSLFIIYILAPIIKDYK